MQYNTTKCIDENQDNKTLKDMTKSGKQRPWREKKIDNVSYADILEILKIKKAFNVKQCGNVLEFKPTDEGYLKLHKTWFCKSKLCPVCNWRRAMKNSYQAQKVIEEVVKEKPTARWLFLTLSTKNAIDGDHLEQSLKHMSKAFNKLKMYTKVKKNLVGFLRSTEVTVKKMTVVITNICTFCYVLKMLILGKRKTILRRRNGSIYGKKHYKLIIDL
ncbi:replication protein Rep [Staphylococcus aureus]|nr:replication protein Rep [Staphylococcus aureus]